MKALQELSGMADVGLWYLGLDTDPDMPTLENGLPGKPIWAMDEDEATILKDALMRHAPKYPAIYRQMRIVNKAYTDLQAGLVLGSRLWETGVELFRQGINLRFSRKKHLEEVDKLHGKKGMAL